MSNTQPEAPKEPTPTTPPMSAVPAATQKPPRSVAAIVALVLGIVALALSFMPIINNFAFILAIVAVVFGIVAVVGTSKGKKAGKGIAVAGLVIAIIAGAAVLASQAAYSAAFDEASREIDKMTGEATEEVLGTDVDITLGDLTLKKSGYGIITSDMPVKVTNLTDGQASFMITIEAVNKDGDRITQDTLYANDLSAGQSQTIKAFTYVSDDDYEAMKSSHFNIVSVSVM